MTLSGIDVVEKKGVFIIDSDNDRVTPLIDGTEHCAFCITEQNVIHCAIEKAFMNGDICFRKPVSCHLYPIRITKNTRASQSASKDFETVKFHNWNICKDALILGKTQKTPLYVFLKEALIRKFGAEWYEQLSLAAELHFVK